ncbi:hypothetical protein E1B28_012669 [Marasmius oreades]|uniref:Uncharacterized protein n=1 Tax=Marasmius oreades TaxID=181124 RepID=A0A9P7UR15_9AGAR|nr:uncharacterized protein E1B28_012669 [Marasmius oreades]KAG7088699.1 hypothetical protein E1B28_012669 [Marasmius oreades]
MSNATYLPSLKKRELNRNPIMSASQNWELTQEKLISFCAMKLFGNRLNLSEDMTYQRHRFLLHLPVKYRRALIIPSLRRNYLSIGTQMDYWVRRLQADAAHALYQCQSSRK